MREIDLKCMMNSAPSEAQEDLKTANRELAMMIRTLHFLFVIAASVTAATYSAPAIPVVFEPSPSRPGSYFARAGSYTAVVEDGAVQIGLLEGRQRTLRLGEAGGARCEGIEPTGGVSNYLLGGEGERTGVPHYAKVRCEGVARGVDAVFYAAGANVEFDLLVAPGASAAEVKLTTDGEAAVTAGGDLLLAAAAGGELKLRRPRVYQTGADGRREVAGRYKISRGKIGFEVGGFDRGRELVIDPEIVFSTVVGPTGGGLNLKRPLGDELSRTASMGLDSAGNIYLAGTVYSGNFPLTPPYNGSRLSSKWVYIAKLSPDGGKLLYSTYLGYAPNIPYPYPEASFGAATVDPDGNVYLSAGTSVLRGTTGAYSNGDCGSGCTVVAKLAASGDRMVFASAFGKLAPVGARAIALDNDRNIYLAGRAGDGFTYGTTLRNSAIVRDPGYSGPVETDIFVAKFSSDGANLLYSARIGGKGFETVNALAVDGNGGAVVVGTTDSRDFPTTPGAFAGFHSGGSDCFVAKLEPGGTGFTYSTYLGGSAQDEAYGVTVAADNTVWVTGSAGAGIGTSLDNTVVTWVDGIAYGLADFGGFLAHLSEWGDSLLHYKPLARGVNGAGLAVAVDAKGLVHVAGSTGVDLQVAGDAFDSSFNSPVDNMAYDAFLARLSPDGTTWLYSTFIGGEQDEAVQSLAVTPEGHTVIAGLTGSKGFPTTGGAYRSNPAAYAGELFVARFSESDARCTASVSPTQFEFEAGAHTATIEVSIEAGCPWQVSGLPRPLPGLAPWLELKSAPRGEGPGSVRLAITTGALRRFSTQEILVAGVPVRITQAAPVSEYSAAAAIVPADGALISGLSFPAVRVASPGSIVTILGRNLRKVAGTVEVTAQDTVSGKLPTWLGGVCVMSPNPSGTGRDVRLPLLRVSPERVDFQMQSYPNMANDSVRFAYASVEVRISPDCPEIERTDNKQSDIAATFRVPYAAAGPDLYYAQVNADGRNPLQAAFVNGGGPVGAEDVAPGESRPAKPGEEVYLYGTGFGLTVPALEAGELATRAMPVSQRIEVRLGETMLEAGTVRAVTVPGKAGVFRIQIRIPDDAPDGNLPVCVTVGGVKSPNRGYLTVRRGE